jgi:exopolysaccharide biosynthesis polyprenyl glycosylphosphotransferase
MLDCLAVLLAWQCTIRLRFLLNPLLNAHVSLEEPLKWVPPLGIILPLWALDRWLRLEKRSRTTGSFDSVMMVGESAFRLVMLTVLVTFFSREFGSDLSRLFVLALAPASLGCLALAHVAGRLASLAAQRHWLRPVRVALVGEAKAVVRLISRESSAQLAKLICGLILPEGAAPMAEGMTPEGLSFSVPVLGTTAQLAELINREQLDHVILVHGSLSMAELDECNRVMTRMGLPVTCAVDLPPEQARVDFSTHLGLPLVEWRPVRFRRAQEMIKRAIDVLIAGLALFGLGPLMLAIALWIKLTSEGPVLYRSARVGKGGRHFTFLKFRSMYQANHRALVAHRNEKSGHIFKLRDDPRVTKPGRFLRRFSLDELPQLINILRGEMSLVGPRPLPAQDLDPDGMSRQFAAWSEGRARVQPGLTGLWQVSGRSTLAFDDMIRLDLEYIQNWSLFLDLNILLSTPMLVLKGVGAY